MKNEKQVFVKALTAMKPGKLTWKTIRIFQDFRTAEDWLMNYVRENHYDIRDFTISAKPDRA